MESPVLTGQGWGLVGKKGQRSLRGQGESLCQYLDKPVSEADFPAVLTESLGKSMLIPECWGVDKIRLIAVRKTEKAIILVLFSH